MVKFESAVATSEKMLNLNDLYDLIDNIPDSITLMDKYQISVAYNKYQSLDTESLSIIDKQREAKLLNAVKIIDELENPSSSSSSSQEISSSSQEASSSISSQTSVSSKQEDSSISSVVSSKESESTSESSLVNSSSSQEISSSSSQQTSSSISSQESSSSVTPTPSKRGGCGSSLGGEICIGGLLLLVATCFIKKAKRN
jgi:hypothetical protein